ncbi:hypothetical protein LTR10_016617 [Elasticomyces elasticus]|uniref:FAD dependent oxidoreductase domain-containing protein n=1 Tax=Exophiala sideris TaxID=1016849 RepID=A0ABR0JJN6_9EURO|nr:hypothetical protein LTR10_016617 [Elasticomyces elasticus]KAK5035262.1 hypothetical protein LTS07_002698 [Exophiala sideris]KAK5039386.1 hypothetical protein LTR13_003643 [Exophiala sideris]KAK5066186.1 hypothetical protein LTR69_002704 [Exophiala sideris]KAK5186863.1 hypothetical protein LTR44_000869 [Eurotiomycetes sp. CCFEE 6388]
MTKITILGAGITGMAIASQLSKNYDVTIMARNLPGDPESYEWASPWAGAIWLGMADSSEAEQRMQLDALAVLMKLARTNPESSVRQIEMLDLMDHNDMSKVWYKDKVPNFRVMSKAELPADAPFGVAYDATILTPMVFLPWLRQKLEASGVKFKRVSVTSLDALKGIEHDILINATGGGPLHLTDVRDQNVQEVRGQTVVVKSKYDKLFVRRGKDYTYAMSRGDGTAILGGDKRYNDTNTEVDDALRDDIIRRVHENLPDAFPSPDIKNYEFVRDIVGIRPQRVGGIRLEKEVRGGQTIIHAYGVGGGGYVFSFGLARRVADIVNELEFTYPVPAKL